MAEKVSNKSDSLLKAEKTRSPSCFVGMKEFENSVEMGDIHVEESLDPLQELLSERTNRKIFDEDGEQPFTVAILKNDDQLALL